MPDEPNMNCATLETFLASVEAMRKHAAVCDEATLERILLQLDELESTVANALSEQEEPEVQNCFSQDSIEEEWTVADAAVKNWGSDEESAFASSFYENNRELFPISGAGLTRAAKTEALLDDSALTTKDTARNEGAGDETAAESTLEDIADWVRALVGRAGPIEDVGAKISSAAPELPALEINDDELEAAEEEHDCAPEIDEQLQDLKQRLGFENEESMTSGKASKESAGSKLSSLREIANASADSAIKVYQKKAEVMIFALRVSQIFCAGCILVGLVWLLASIFF